MGRDNTKWCEWLQGDKQKNGNSIFLPLAGYYSQYGYLTGSIYWSSSLIPSHPNNAYTLGGSHDRTDGGSIRPVCP